MQKDHIRDYATEAFRHYAALGKPTFDELYKFYYKRATDEYKQGHEKGSGISSPTESAVIFAETRIKEKMAELEDILAVERTMVQLYEFESNAIERVYFLEANKPLKKNDISERVCKSSMEMYCDIRTIYRYLRKARMIFAYERGLRR